MCGILGLLCIVIKGGVGGSSNVCDVWDARFFAFYHKGLCGRLQ
jgi:hypothetical protein